MPLLQTRQLDEHTTLGIWSLVEDVEELITVLPAHIELDANLLESHVRRQKEWLTSRILTCHLLKRFTEDPLPLHRNPDGKPFFEQDRYFISITHSPELVAVILSDKYEVGIDVEILSPKALRLASKFLTDDERQQTGDQINKTCLYWSAKETLYKLYSRKKLIFKDNLFLTPTESNNVLSGCIRTDNFFKLYQIQYEKVQNHMLTFCIDNSTNTNS